MFPRLALVTTVLSLATPACSDDPVTTGAEGPGYGSGGAESSSGSGGAGTEPGPTCGAPEQRCAAAEDCWPWTCTCNDGTEFVVRQCGGDRRCSGASSTCATACDFNLGLEGTAEYGGGPLACEGDSDRCPAWSCGCNDGTAHTSRRCAGQCCDNGEGVCESACAPAGGLASVSGPTAPPRVTGGGSGGGSGTGSAPGSGSTSGSGGGDPGAVQACTNNCPSRFPCPATPHERCLYCQAACACQCAGQTACANSNNQAACALNGCCW